MKKTYVLDTSVVIYDPYCFDKFPDSNIVIPIYVLNELDDIKRRLIDSGKSARVFIRLLNEICSKGKLHEGIPLDDISSTLTVDVVADDLFRFGDPTGDNKILSCAYRLNDRQDVILVSRDINLRIRAQSYGIEVQDYVKEDKNGLNSRSDLVYSGVSVVKNGMLSTKLCESKTIPCDDYEELKLIYPNECVYICDENGGGITLGRRVGNNIRVVRDQSAWGIKARNKEQNFALDLLLDNNVELVSLIGRAGTGKSLLAIAAGLELLINKKQYDKLIIYRPVQPIGNDLGFLPGSMKEKLGPWMEAVVDALELLTSKSDSSKKSESSSKKSDGFKTKKRRKTGYGKDDDLPAETWKKTWREKLGQYADQIYLEPITYLRGRSIPNAYMILDESQNCSQEHIKTVLTRVGEGSKVIISGDIDQTDSRDLDALNNGLTYVSTAFKQESIAGHITLVKGERSRLATIASKIL